ncbi:hypothetical protein GCM10011571_17350 [Marinithermofilum abyssi]|uniref:Lipoprotein n=1 Tax=Marinithermofilum abyssi TaxID=1571185 RepID=A0A8J2VDQ7_9BACL|nr:hypothetical protein [Marinithermofilum abyssi]GGE16214.1 hypothetical protein GCM10011571_17350 [Marinithermofilum abyssi]
MIKRMGIPMLLLLLITGCSPKMEFSFDCEDQTMTVELTNTWTADGHWEVHTYPLDPPPNDEGASDKLVFKQRHSGDDITVEGIKPGYTVSVIFAGLTNHGYQKLIGATQYKACGSYTPVKYYNP